MIRKSPRNRKSFYLVSCYLSSNFCSKELKEICLVDQVYVKAEDGKQTVGKYLEQVSKEVGAPVSVKKFVRFETGEGLEKKNEDFAAEVAAQIAGN